MTASNPVQIPRYRAIQPPHRLNFSYRSIQIVSAASDLFVIVLLSVAAGISYHYLAFERSGDINRYVATGVAVGSIFVVRMQLRELYRARELFLLCKQVRHAVLSWAGSFGFLIMVSFALKLGEAFSRGAIATFFFAGLVVLPLSRLAWARFLTVVMESGRLATSAVLLIHDRQERRDHEPPPDLQRFGFTVVAILNPPSLTFDERALDDLVKDAVAVARQVQIDEIFLSTTFDKLGVANGLMERLRTIPLPVRLIVSGAAAELIRNPVEPFDDALVFQAQRHPLSLSERALKRLLDLLLAGTAMLMLSPAMMIVALAIKLDSPGPILFKQLRYGANGRRFRILKFRSMTVMEDGAAVRQAQRHDPRVTRVGRIIRGSSIDELPQLWNVLRGEMSIVGPRPHAVAHDDHYEELIRRYAVRRRVKPGLTGWAQVNGSRGETPTVESMERRIGYDLWYIDNWSISLEILIILKTVLLLADTKNTY